MIESLMFLWIQNNKYGCISLNKEIIIPCIYDDVSEIINNCIWVKENNKWWIINYKNEKIVQNSFVKIIGFNETISIVECDNENFCLIDHSQEHKIIKIKKGIIPINLSSNNLIGFKKNNLYGFLNKNGEIFINNEYEFVNPFFENLSSVKKNGKWGLINQKNEVIINFKYDYMSIDCSGFIKVNYENKSFFIDKNENKYLDNLNSNFNLFEFSELMLGFEYKNKKGYMNQFFEIEIQKKFDEIKPFKNGFAIVKYKNKYGVLNKTMSYVIKPNFDYIWHSTKNTFIVKKNSSIFLINQYGKKIFND